MRQRGYSKVDGGSRRGLSNPARRELHPNTRGAATVIVCVRHTNTSVSVYTRNRFVKPAKSVLRLDGGGHKV